MMKRVLTVGLMAGVLALGIQSKAEATVQLQLRVCQGGALCQDFPGPGPGTTSPGPGPFTNNNIVVGDFEISGSVSSLENASLSNAATVTISIQRLTQNDTGDLQIWLNATNYNLPTGPKTFTETLSGTSSGGVAGATENFQGWFSGTDASGFPPAGSTALAATNCGSLAGSVSCAAPSVSTLVTGGLPFSMVSLTTVHIPTASAIATYTSNAQVNVTPVPEPASMLLLGTGLLGAARFGRRRFKQATL